MSACNIRSPRYLPKGETQIFQTAQEQPWFAASSSGRSLNSSGLRRTDPAPIIRFGSSAFLQAPARDKTTASSRPPELIRKDAARSQPGVGGSRSCGGAQLGLVAAFVLASRRFRRPHLALLMHCPAASEDRWRVFFKADQAFGVPKATVILRLCSSLSQRNLNEYSSLRPGNERVYHLQL